MKSARKLPLGVLVLGALAMVAASHASARMGENVRVPEQPATREIPFKGTLAGIHVSRTALDAPFVFDRFELSGEATHLGRFTVVIESTVNFGSRPVTGAGTYTFTAANGDRLVAHHTGLSSLVRPGTVLITEHALVDPDLSTGRFAGADGALTVERLADAATGVGGQTEGTIDGTILLVPSGPR